MGKLKELKNNIKSYYVFTIILLITAVVFYFIYMQLHTIKKHITDIDYTNSIKNITTLSINIYTHIQHQLLTKKCRLQLKKELSLLTTDDNTIYIVEKINNHFETTIGKSKHNYQQQYEKAFFDNRDILFTTKDSIVYIKPIIYNHKIIALLVSDFSLQEHKEIEKALMHFQKLFNLLSAFFIFVFAIIGILIYLDYKREKELEQLNNSLKNKIREEIYKNSQKERQLLYQNRLAQMGEMISMIAHQWRQPLGAISAIAMGVKVKIQMKQLDLKQLDNKMESIIKYTNYLSQTIDDFRNFFKPTKEKKLVTFNELLSSVIEIVENSLKNKEIEIFTDVEYMEEFYAYSNELKQVILNLIKNAEDALLERNIENKRIYISAYKDKDDIVLKIEDNAGGIDSKIIDKIFEPYFSTKIDKNGTGLGLYMSKIIIEKYHKGEIKAYNSEIGAVFEIRLKDGE